MTARALLLTGTVGVGKTSVAAAVGDDHDGLDWHLHRSGELAAIQDASAVEDARVDVGVLSVADAASRVLELWDARDSRAWRH